jgi:hypothetical protein
MAEVARAMSLILCGFLVVMLAPFLDPIGSDDGRVLVFAVGALMFVGGLFLTRRRIRRLRVGGKERLLRLALEKREESTPHNALVLCPVESLAQLQIDPGVTPLRSANRPSIRRRCIGTRRQLEERARISGSTDRWCGGGAGHRQVPTVARRVRKLRLGRRQQAVEGEPPLP